MGISEAFWLAAFGTTAFFQIVDGEVFHGRALHSGAEEGKRSDHGELSLYLFEGVLFLQHLQMSFIPLPKLRFLMRIF
jgi:hypothetical protein